MEKSEFLKQLGKHIKEIRSKKGWSQADLARASFKDPQSVERLENGKINPSAYYLKEIAVSLKIPLFEIFNFKITNLPK